MSELLSPKEACRELGISYITLWRWIRERKIKAVRLPSERYAIPKSEIERIKGSRPEEKKQIRCVIYARVSSHKQKEQGDLGRQVELLKKYAQEKGYQIVDNNNRCWKWTKREEEGSTETVKVCSKSKGRRCPCNVQR